MFAVLGHEIAHVWQGFACGEGWPSEACELLACVMTVVALEHSKRNVIAEKEDQHLRNEPDSEYVRLMSYQRADSHFLRRLFDCMMKKYNICWKDILENEKIARWKRILKECKP